MIRSAVAVWKGSPAAGEGSVSTTSGVISKALYAFGSSTGNEPCTSPSEMLAASLASCTSLIVTQEMAKLGLRSEMVKTESQLTLQEHKGQWEITSVELQVTARLADSDAGKFQRAARNAKSKCPISRSLNVPIKMSAALEPVATATVA